MKRGDTLTIASTYIVNPITDDTLSMTMDEAAPDFPLGAPVTIDGMAGDFVVSYQHGTRLDITPRASWKRFRERRH